MSILAVPYAVMAQPATVTPPVVLHPIQDLTLAKGTKKTIDLSHLGSFRVDNSVSSVVYATYSSAEQKYVDLKGLDQEGPTVITITDNASNQIVEQFKVHVLDAGNDERIDIGDVTKYIASHPADVTQASDVRTLLNGVEPFNTTKVVNNPPIVVGKPGTVYLVNGEPSAPKTVSMATYFSDDTTLSYSLINPPAYLNANIQELSGMLTINGVNLPVNETRTEWLTVQARNEHGLTATIDVEIFINAKVVNNPPRVSEDAVRSIDAVQNKPFEKTIDLSTVFTDDPGDELVFIIEGVLPNGLTASFLSGNTVIVSGTPTQAGSEYRIVLRATDSSGASAQHEITVRVAEEEQKPAPIVVGNPGTIYLINGYIGAPQTVNMATYFWDSVPLTYSIGLNPYNVDASIETATGELTIRGLTQPLPEPAIIYVQIQATNTSGKTATINVPITIESPAFLYHNQDGPMPASEPIAEMFADISATHFEITRPPGGTLTAFIEQNDSADARIVFDGIAEETFLVVKGTNPTTGASVERKIRFIFNQPPQVTDIPVAPILAEQGTPLVNVTRNLNGLFIDQPDQNLVYSIEEMGSPSGLEASVEGGVLHVAGTPVSPGWYSFDIRATDPKGLYATRQIEVQVVNRPEAVVTPEAVEWVYGVTQNKVLNGSEYFGEGGWEFTYSIEAPAEVAAFMDSKTGELIIQNVNPPANGTYVIKVKATNSFGTNAVVDIPIHVKLPTTITWNAGAAMPYEFDFSSYFSGTGATQFEVSPSYPGITVSIVEGTQHLQLSGVQADTLVTIKGTNLSNNSTTEVLLRFVTDYPIPFLDGSPASPETIEVTNGPVMEERFTPYLSSYFDGQDVTFELMPYTNPTGYIEANIVDGWLLVGEVYFPDNIIRTAYLDVKVTNDRNKSTTISFPVVVRAMPAPEVVVTPEPLIFQDEIKKSYDVSLGSYFKNPSGLNFIVENEEELMEQYHIRASLDGYLYVENTATINNTEDLNLTINIIATDSFNQSTRLQIPIVIKPKNNEPVVSNDGINTIYMDTFDERDNVIDLRLLNLFTDPDEGDSITGFSTSLGYVTVDQYLFLPVNSLEQGATLTITAHDQANHTVSKTIQIANSPIGDTYSQVNPGIPFQYGDEFLPALPADPEDQSRRIYLVDPNNTLFYNTTYNSAARANEITITNEPSSVQFGRVTLHYVNKVDHTLTLDVFDIAITV
ncbi:putative Ig domain-containing protein [Paenibacillus sp. NPDC056579]|uniref:putative Ig domain-containing protein n=1 Tax=Paenibacillus sp. NPDC056579 TaxID=3345871 RepID=UPI0036BC1FF5